MAKRGRAGIALGIAAIGSFFAGSVATVFVAGLAIPLTNVALRFGPVEFFSLMLLGLVFAAALARGPMLNAVITIVFGVLLSTIGPDLVTGQLRMTFGVNELADGIDFAILGMGLFGIGEILRNLDHSMSREVLKSRIGRLLPGKKELRQSAWPIFRGTMVGAALGILPGNGAVLGAFASYILEKKVARDPTRFGAGAIEGVAGPESANNAGAQTSFIPLLTLGIPANAVMAIMVGAMTIHGIVPGPQVISANPDLFWGLVASMWIGNLMLLVINLPMIGIWVKLLSVPYRMLFPAIILFCCIGAFSLNGSTVEIALLAVFGLLGYAMSKFGFEPAPLALGMILGSRMEEALRQSLIISDGDFRIFVTRPISAALLLGAVVLVAIVLVPEIRKRREEVFAEEED
jgi:putative tricarboxylic transport membrane protein